MGVELSGYSDHQVGIMAVPLHGGGTSPVSPRGVSIIGEGYLGSNDQEVVGEEASLQEGIGRGPA